MFDCFEKSCEVCGTAIYSVNISNGDLLCKECEKAVKDATEQRQYLVKLYKK